MATNNVGCTPHLLVAAIDIGTAYSGWAYSFFHDFKADPTKVYTKQWHSDSGTLVTLKTPTVVLIRPDGKTLEAFGYDAENTYRDLVDTGKHHHYYYFRHFKMMLHKQLSEKLDRNTKLSDEMGKKLTAIDVFAMSIKYLVDDMYKETKLRYIGDIKTSEIHWVITVPAIWTDSAKQFMSEAAVKAGIDRCKLSIALEPEAASIYCRHLKIDQTVNQMSLSSLSVGTRYMVIDAGGGTTDITIHEVVDSKMVKEVKAASGGGWGSILVNQAFEDLLRDIFGKDVYEDFKSKNTEDWLDITRDFEVKKKSICPEQNRDIVVRLPLSLCQLFNEKNKTTLTDYIKNNSDYSGKVKIDQDKMKFQAEIFKELMEKVNKSILQHLSSLVKDDLLSVSVILMVGGYSESAMLQKAVQNLFRYKQIIVPHEALTAVLKGALICGHCPEFMTERILRYSYGLESMVDFVAGKHPYSKRTETDIGPLCKDVFSLHLKKDLVVKVGETQLTKKYRPVYKNQRSMRFGVYATEKNTPYFVDDGCIKIGTMTIKGLDGSLDCRMDVAFIFSGTAIKVEGKVSSTGKKTDVEIDFLG